MARPFVSYVSSRLRQGIHSIKITGGSRTGVGPLISKLSATVVNLEGLAVGGVAVTTSVTLGAVTATNLIVSGSAALDHPIDLNSIAGSTADETSDFGNIIKAKRTSGAVGGTQSGIICKHYLEGGVVDGTAVVSGLYVNLKYEPTSENAAAEVSLMETHLYSSASDAIDYAWYCLAPASKISSLIGISGTMTNLIEFKADGAGGLTVGATMTADPADDAEDAFITVKIEGGVSYQIPLYAA